MSRPMVTKIDANDVERFSTLNVNDIGKYAAVTNGCFFIKDSYEDAMELLRVLLDD